MGYDITKHGDFHRYYDTELKKNYWVLGYFGGGAINIEDAYSLGVQFAKAINVPFSSVSIDEILSSDEDGQSPEANSDQMTNVDAWLRD